MASLFLFNRLTGKKEPFCPIDPQKITLYVCGPTVYDRIHIGNARPLLVFDLLYRLLKTLYSEVVYVRNITDVDDKINKAAAEQGLSIQAFTQGTLQAFYEDIESLRLLSPTHEPRATDFIVPILSLIQILIEKGIAYQAQGHILFSVDKVPSYGSLSNMPLTAMRAGARVEVAPYKENPLDFVLWKPSHEQEVGWDSPWGRGRPGWHIECSAMSSHFLGPLFDIHGGGKDLVFPHHENERAQTCAAFSISECAHYWVHNEMVLVEGQKMSKSLGNFIPLHAAQVPAEVIRWSLFSAHYRHVLDWTSSLLHQSFVALNSLYRVFSHHEREEISPEEPIEEGIKEALYDDMNTPQALMLLQGLIKNVHDHPSDKTSFRKLKASAHFMGLGLLSCENWFRPVHSLPLSHEEIKKLIEKRRLARKSKAYEEADSIREKLASYGILLEDERETTSWRFLPPELSLLPNLL